MAKVVSTKRILIDKANTTVVIVTGIAAFVLVFCGVATKALISQAGYQNRVISAKKEAVQQLKTNIDAADALKSSYQGFTSTAQNVLGGNPGGNGPQDGNNAEIVLAALPSSYDFPALATSLEKLISSQNVEIQSITGTDDEVAQSANTQSATPEPVAIPFSVSVRGNYDGVKNLVATFERSIRPVEVQTLNISGNNKDGLSIDITAQTYYQPAKTLNISKTVVK